MVPTALELAGVKPSKGYTIDGASMLTLLQGNDEPIHNSLYFEMGATRAILKDGYKYLSFKAPTSVKSKLEKKGKKATHLCDQPGGRGSESPALKFYAKNYFSEDQFYNVADDKKESENLFNNYNNHVKIEELKKELKAYIEVVPGTFPIPAAIKRRTFKD